ncbi:ThuA domain-containing protein [Desertimonas flava]|uniref:ThuA domain-containing protein n=1 Tax=Desertimonas flava TaxID=2064846 RepID=UPI000E3424E5|nr:ThuA domain-containing protein [Desertimonas flava]
MGDRPVDTLVVTGGHPFEAEPFFAVFDSLDSITWTSATEPGDGHDVVVFYDMPGLRFTRGDPPVEVVEPTPDQRAAIARLCERGTGLVFLHHAVAGWPAWPAYAELVGGRFHYQPATLCGTEYPDSGYRFDVEHTVEVLDPAHPVCAGLGPSFSLTDELYCAPVFEDRVVPLMRTSFPTGDPAQFFSADQAIRGVRNRNDGWSHPPGSNLVAWAKAAGRSPVVYLQFGDGPVTYADPSYRRALANAIAWVASPDAREWAAARHEEVPR